MDLSHKPEDDETYSHCRWKTVLCKELEQMTDEYRNQFRGQTFERVFQTMWNRLKRIKGLGKLTVYDMTATICRLHNIPITKVHIIGKGPERAIHILNQRNIQIQSYKIGRIKLYYVNVEPLCEFFQIENNDGDWWESYICKWQKSI